MSLMSSVLTDGFFTTGTTWEAQIINTPIKIKKKRIPSGQDGASDVMPVRILFTLTPPPFTDTSVVRDACQSP